MLYSSLLRNAQNELTPSNFYFFMKTWTDIRNSELLQKAELPELSIPSTIFLPPEKTIPLGERLQPWDHLHHPGYWYDQAIRHHYLRCSYALAMPDEYVEFSEENPLFWQNHEVGI